MAAKGRKTRRFGLQERAYEYQHARNEFGYRPWYVAGCTPYESWRSSRGARKFRRGQVRRARRQQFAWPARNGMATTEGLWRR